MVLVADIKDCFQEEDQIEFTDVKTILFTVKGASGEMIFSDLDKKASHSVANAGTGIVVEKLIEFVHADNPTDAKYSAE